MKTYLEPTQESGRALFQRGITGSIIMLNLIRLRDVADYTGSPKLAPPSPISGAEALDRYISHTMPFLQQSGGELSLLARGGAYFIGPPDEHWDVAMLVRQNSLASFMAFASNPEYMAGLGHRTAAASDSRLLPLEQCSQIA